MKGRRISVTFSEETCRELEQMLPEGGRSRFIEEAVWEKLRRDKFGKALEQAAGVLKKEDYPEFATLEGIHEWLDRLRAGTR